ncbi:MAG: hypothetical protein OGM09_12405 [Fusobacterium varium]|uniref:hypothetical protein n=1 Tax=Fusobacterium varium TaxID=856 RepID=UPI00242C8914|nr:hypothetical protein [Fusobacterium varium]UYI77949.1 MAG: hypothetical protein OGM09_12405 [Fusobacterium varium]
MNFRKIYILILKQIIFTSATIAIGSDFSYFKESIGLEEDTLDKVIHSPFDYDKQMKYIFQMIFLILLIEIL